MRLAGRIAAPPRVMGKAAKEACELAHLKLDDIDLFIPHQANLRIISAASKFLKLPDEKVMVNVQKYGNTSSASIPLAFCEAVEQKRLAVIGPEGFVHALPVEEPMIENGDDGVLLIGNEAAPPPAACPPPAFAR